MSENKEAARRQVKKLVDEMIANLRKISRDALTMDTISVLAIARITTQLFNQLVAVYNALDDGLTPPKIKDDKTSLL